MPKFAVLLALFCGVVCVYIELLNARCGVLPRQEWRNSDPEQGMVKWRASPVTSEVSWRRFVLAREDPQNGDAATRELSYAEKQRMQEAIDRENANNTLRSVVGTYGLVQHLAIVVLIAIGIIGIQKANSPRWLYVVLLSIAAICGWRALSLGYFASLGG